MPDYHTLLYKESDGIAWVTLNRPEVHNAMNARLRDELRAVWADLRRRDEVRVVVLTGAGDVAFSTGVDREETLAAAGPEGLASTPFMFDDLFDGVGPKSADLWKPVIAAVNGMACGGAFYLLGEVDFIIAADHATFFDPHVTYGMPAAFEPVHMLQKMPLHEVLRMTLLGNHERLSAARAHQIGLVSEVVPSDSLTEAARWAAAAIASAPPLAVQATLRAIWAGLEHTRGQALAQCYAYIAMGLDPAALQEGQQAFASGQRIEWKLR